MTPIEAMLHILRDEGVRHVFGNPGTTELPFIDALAGQSELDYVLAVQELTAVAMADGYARVTRRPAFVSLHVAAGVANGLIGMLNASRSRTPLVIAAGQQDRRHLVQDPMLSGDLVGLASSAVKQAVEVRRGADLPVLLRRAFATARAVPTGPVLLSIPMDVLTEDTDVPVLDRSEIMPRGPATGLARAAELLCGARRPAIVAGDGVGRDRALAALVELAEAAGAVVYHQPMNDGVNFPGHHPLFRGPLRPTNEAIREALAEHDVVFIVGTHAFMPHHFTPGPPVPADARVLQLDVDAAEIGRNFAVEVGLVGALDPTLRALAALVTVPDAAERLALAGQASAAERAGADAEGRAAYGDAPLRPRAAAHAVAAGLPEDAIVVEEAITVGVHLRDVLRQDVPGSYAHTIGGGLGWGIGAAIGTRLGAPDRPVVAVLGDGCTMFGIQGLWTAARYRVPVTFVVMNNGEYRTLKESLEHGSTSAKLRHYVGLDLAPPALDWTKAADFFGVRSIRVGSADELRSVVARSPDEPLLVDVPVSGHAADHGY